ncbi:APC family permease [Amycolatopsis jejuensis]|uniref:APC family permease n=1 Tax=Amycolatopsis jejuensis TaxID=330084 RepID=UPI00068CFFD2|nr:APC family permease [Amycolatopsis jejuensis]
MTAERTLLRRLGLLGVVFFGVSYMAPAVVNTTFGVVSQLSGGAAPMAYAVATVAILPTAVAYAVLARNFPTAGSSYTYVNETLGRVFGFFTGWVILLDYLFLPMVVWLLQAIYLNAQFPGIPVWVWLLLNGAATTAINLLGIVLADRVNTWLTVASILATAGTVVVIGIFLGGHSAEPGAPGPLWNDQASWGTIGAAAAVAAYSFLGFDAISTLSEETRNARRNIPLGIMLTVVIGGIIFITVSLLMQLLHPGGQFDNADTAGYTLLAVAGGNTYANITNLVFVVASFGSGLAIQATSSRLMFVMGRDGVLPRETFGRLSRAFRVPWINILIIAAVGLIGLFLTLESSTALINFGAFLAFAMVNLAFLAWLWRPGRPDLATGTRVLLSVLPIAGAAVDLYLFANLHVQAYLVGGSWLVLGIGCLAFVTKGFRRPVPRLGSETGETGESPSRIGEVEKS